MKNEAELRSTMVKGFRAAGYMATPIESGSTGLGIPDLFVRLPFCGFWAELKNLRYPVRLPLEVPFRPGQYSWLARHHALGGTSMLVMGTPGMNYVFVNENIQKVYDRPLEQYASFAFNRFNAREFVGWLRDSRA